MGKKEKLKLPIFYRHSFPGIVTHKENTEHTINQREFHFPRASALPLTFLLTTEEGLVWAVKWCSTC